MSCVSRLPLIYPLPLSIEGGIVLTQSTTILKKKKNVTSTPLLLSVKTPDSLYSVLLLRLVNDGCGLVVWPVC